MRKTGKRIRKINYKTETKEHKEKERKEEEDMENKN